MVTKLILFKVSIFFAQTLRGLLNFIRILQLLPFFFLLVLTVAVGLIFYRLFGVHRLFVNITKLILRGSFFLRGVHYTFKVPKHLTIHSLRGLNICNQGNAIYWILFAVLPYDHLIISADQFFSVRSYRSLLFLLGFVPQEYGITPENIQSYESRMQHYIEQDFSLWQPCFFEYRDSEALPYLLFLGIKFNQGINIWKITGLEYIERVSWLNRVRVIIELVQQIPIARRVPVTIAAYEQSLAQNFGLPESDKFSNQNFLSGALPSNTEIAKQKIEQAKKRRAESEKKGRAQ